MSPDNVVDYAIEQIADGQSVDWPRLDSEAQTDGERESLKCLRIVDEVATVHRSTEDPFDPADEAPTLQSDHGSSGSAGADGDMWGRYRLAEKVGEGSFGSVYRAWDPELERDVAIKILHGHVADNEVKERLLREGRALAKVRHPNVVSVLGVESHGNRVGLCMEFIRGKTLETALRTQGLLNAREAQLVGEDVCRALAAVHQAGFVHRDVKARNVMRESAGRIVLMDFGTGRHADRGVGDPVDHAGTPVYMAPELLAGEPASISSDVYSVGVLLYHLVTSEYPADGRSMDELRAAHTKGLARPLGDRRPDLPLPFMRVVERALASDARRRYPSAGTLLESLAALSAESRPDTRSWTRYLLGAIAAVVGAAGGLTAVGFLASTFFNGKLGRSDFVAEGVSDWFLWGVRSSVAPTFLLMAILLCLAMAVVLRRLALAFSLVRRLDGTLRHAADAAGHSLRLHEASVVASCVLLVCVSALLYTLWRFAPLFGVLVNDSDWLISTAPAADLALLSSAFTDYQQNYQLAVSAVAILSIIGWYPVLRLIRRGQTVNWGLPVAGAVVACFAILAHNVPYRVLVHNEFQVAAWKGIDCYILGERSDDFLLFCPELQPPRNRIVNSATKDLKRTGIRESIFTRFGSSVGGRFR